MTVNATTTIDDTSALALFVTWLININVPDKPLPDELIIRGATLLRRQWAAQGYTPHEPMQAACLYAAMVWDVMLEVDRLRWMARLIDVCAN